MNTSIKISFKSFFIIFLSLMVSNVSYSSDVFKDGNNIFQIEIEEEEEDNFFHSNSNEYQDNLITDGGNNISSEIIFIEELSFSFPQVLRESFSIDEFSNESFHVPLYIKYCNSKVYIC